MEFLSQQDALIEAAQTFAMHYGTDGFQIVGIERNHQDDQAWDVLVKLDGEVWRATTWKEQGDCYCEW